MNSPSPIPFDHDAIRSHVEMIHDLAAGQDGILPLCVYGENPDSKCKTTVVQHFHIGDVDKMTSAAIAYENHPDANVYMPLAVMRRDLPRGEKGGEKDVVAVLGAVIDDDADAGREAKPPVKINYALETSSSPAMNQQAFILFNGPLPPSEAKPIVEALHKVSGGDHSTKDLSHVWRIPGTANWPNRKKVIERNRPRDPQPVRVLKPWDGSLTSVNELCEVLAPHMNGAKPNGKAHDTGVRKLIMAPPIEGEDRSGTLASVVTSIIRFGLSDAEIQTVIEAHPHGIGAKYIGRPDLATEIARLREKFGANDANGSANQNSQGQSGTGQSSACPEQIFDPWDEYVVPPFPLGILPASVQRFVETQSRVIGCDPASVAMAALVNFSAAIDHRTKLKMLRNGGWYVSPRLWVLLYGDPSRKKTPPIKVATAGLQERQDELLDAWERERDAAKEADPDADDPPRPPRFVVGDTTVEKLGEILMRSGRGVLVKREEFSGLIASMERYGGSGGSDRSFWIDAYDGGPHTVDRIKRGEMRIPNLSVSLIGGIQPERLKELHGLTSDGLLQRFIPVIVGQATFPADERTDTHFDMYKKLTRTLLGGRYASVIMSDAGLEVAAHARRRVHEIEKVTGGLAPGFQAFVGKLPGVLGSLALILHMINEPHDGATLPVGAKTVMNAARIIEEFVLPHAFEFYRTAESTTDGDRLQKVASYILTAGKNRILVSDLTRNVATLRGLTLWDVNQRVSPLVAGGWLVPVDKGPVSHGWTVSQAVFGQLRARGEEEERRKAALAKLMRSPRREGPM